MNDRLSSVFDCIVISNEPLVVVNKFLYLGDMIGEGSGVEESIVGRELLLLLTSTVFSLLTKGTIFQAWWEWCSPW